MMQLLSLLHMGKWPLILEKTLTPLHWENSSGAFSAKGKVEFMANAFKQQLEKILWMTLILFLFNQVQWSLLESKKEHGWTLWSMIIWWYINFLPEACRRFPVFLFFFVFFFLASTDPWWLVNYPYIFLRFHLFVCLSVTGLDWLMGNGC